MKTKKKLNVEIEKPVELFSWQTYPQAFPWQQSAWQQILSRLHENKLPHAILLQGAEGIGKFHFAQLFAAHLLCEKKSWCRQCASCHLMMANNHPDLHVITPEETSKTIKIEQIRGLIALLNETAYSGTYRIAIINPADGLNNYGANALLKTLEEPGKQTILFLISAQAYLLPATIRSRCQKISLPMATTEQANFWLQERSQLAAEQCLFALQVAAGSPLKALKLLQMPALTSYQDFLKDLLQLWSGSLSPLELATRLFKEAIPNDYILWLMQWVMVLIRHKFRQVEGQHVDEITLLNESHKISAPALYVYLDRIYNARKHMLIGANINMQLLWENLMIEWAILLK